MHIENISTYFREFVEGKFEYQKDAAEHFDVSPAFISAVIKGHREPTKAMLEEMGVNRVRETIVTYSLR